MATHSTMEAEGIAGILAGISGLVTGGLGGIKWVKNQQLEDVKGLITQYKEANEFTKGEMSDIKESLAETRKMHQDCEDGRNALACEIKEYKKEQDKMKAIILKHIKPD